MTIADPRLFRLAMQCGIVKRGCTQLLVQPNDVAVVAAATAAAVVVICCRCYLWFLSFLLLFDFPYCCRVDAVMVSAATVAVAGGAGSH